MEQTHLNSETQNEGLKILLLTYIELAIDLASLVSLASVVFVKLEALLVNLLDTGEEGKKIFASEVGALHKFGSTSDKRVHPHLYTLYGKHRYDEICMQNYAKMYNIIYLRCK